MIQALMFPMVEQAPGAFGLRCVTNDSLISDLRAQGALQGFLRDVDELYSEFRARFDESGKSQCLN
jgi:hypothetical protein